MRPIEPTRAAVWAAWRDARLEGRVRRVRRSFTAGHWRVTIKQRRRHHEMWYPGTADGLARAERQRRLAEALR